MTPMAALTAGANRPGATADLGPGGPPAARTTGPAGRDRPAAVSSGTRTVRSWPLLVLAAPAAAEVWSGWVGIAQLDLAALSILSRSAWTARPVQPALARGEGRPRGHRLRGPA